MDQIRKLFESLTWKQVLSLVLAAAGVIGGAVGAGALESASATSGRFTAARCRRCRRGGGEAPGRRLGIPFGAKTGRRCWFLPARWPSCACDLAAAGIPKSGRIGFELFDKTNFGASDFAEQVNYHRALEGELERSVMSLAEVEQARVHITFAEGFHVPGIAPAGQSQRAGEAAARRAAVGPERGRDLPADRQRGGGPCAGSGFGGRHARQPAEPGAQAACPATIAEPSEAALDYRQKIEHDLLAKINGTLEPLLGADKFRATASVDCDFTSADQSEETFDPNKSVMVSSQKTEDISGGSLAVGSTGHRLEPAAADFAASDRHGRSYAAHREHHLSDPAARCATCGCRRAS